MFPGMKHCVLYQNILYKKCSYLSNRIVIIFLLAMQVLKFVQLILKTDNFSNMFFEKDIYLKLKKKLRPKY